jgi:hypothetical protein
MRCSTHREVPVNNFSEVGTGKLRADYILGFLAIMQFRLVYFLVTCIKLNN